MGSIPLPALSIHNQAAQTDPTESLGRILALRNTAALLPLQQQEAQQRVQLLQQQVQMGQQDLQARQALNQAFASSVTKDESGKSSFDPDKLQSAIMQGPAAYQAPQVMENLTKFQKARVDLQNSQADLQGKMSDLTGSAAAAIKAANYDPNVAHGLLDSVFANSPDSPQAQQARMMINSPQMLKQWVDTQIAKSPKQQTMQNEQTVAQIRAGANPEVQEMNSWIAQNPGKTPADYQVYKKNLEVQADVAKETNPQIQNARANLAAREAAARQAVTQGDPKAAAQLLISGDATMSELNARGATPEFKAKVLYIAHQLSGGQYNAMASDAQYKVAQSPANVAFFGSAKSLTDKGGTLDQLQQAAKDIPGGQIPVFNSIADAEKAATGSGPIAKYASLALGVADDYSKVMGGGQGSDASRAAALALVSAKQSPEQRAASIEGIRGAVSSQTNSRIGANPVLKRMYGSDEAAGGGAGINVGSVITQNGHRYKVTAVDKNGKPTAADPVQ